MSVEFASDTNCWSERLCFDRRSLCPLLDQILAEHRLWLWLCLRFACCLSLTTPPVSLHTHTHFHFTTDCLSVASVLGAIADCGVLMLMLLVLDGV